MVRGDVIWAFAIGFLKTICFDFREWAEPTLIAGISDILTASINLNLQNFVICESSTHCFALSVDIFFTYDISKAFFTEVFIWFKTENIFWVYACFLIDHKRNIFRTEFLNLSGRYT